MVDFVDFTVAIPTYNGEQRLPEVSEKLRSQLNPNGIRWEVLVVDNNSHDRTFQIVQNYQIHFPVAILYSLATQQGAGYARQAAVHQAKSDLIGFLDDDNLPDASWLNAAYEFAQAHPQAGAYASQIRGQFEVNPPETMQRILPFLAITQRGSQPKLYLPQRHLLPPSAALVVRKQAWLAHVPTEGILVKLKFKRSDGNHCSEDLEALSYLLRSPWEVWYNPAMTVAHKIPSWRLERSYLIPLFRSIGLSRHVTRMLNLSSWQQPVMFVAYLANDLRKILFYYFKYRSQLQTDVAAACEMALFANSLISPFYLWKNKYSSKWSD